MYELECAAQVANRLVRFLEPYCERIMVVGSIRRLRPQIKDIDLLAIASSLGGLAMALIKHGEILTKRRIDNCTKIIKYRFEAVPIDIYIADVNTWPMILLVRTGSASHNQRLAMLAKRQELHFAADGQGILDSDGRRISGETEESIFEALGLDYVAPEERE